MREEQDDLFCRIYVDGGIAADELATMLAQDLDGQRTGQTVTVGRTLVQVRASDGYDPDRRHDQLSGFLYFPLNVEVAALAGQDRVAHIGTTRRALQALWAHDLTAVASCDYEQALPNEGYKSRYAP
jgi:hypothetical protein